VVDSLILNDSAIIDGLAQMLTTVQQMQARSDQSQRRIAEEIRSLSLEIEKHVKMLGSRQPIVITTDDFAAQNPEVGLLTYLYSFLPDGNAIDVGAHIGRVSERLLKSGYTVYAFEPYAPAFEILQEKLKADAKFHPSTFAIGPADKIMDLHIASDVTGANKSDPSLFNSLVEHSLGEHFQFQRIVPVQVRSLESLRQTGEIPETVGLPFCGDGGVLGFCTSETITKSWGNVLFFLDHAPFAKALRWCEEVLAPTWYR